MTNIESGLALRSNITVGNEADVVNLRFSSNAPGAFRVGVVFYSSGGGDGVNLIRLRQTAGLGLNNSLATRALSVSVAVAFFDLTNTHEGDVFTLSLAKATGQSGNANVPYAGLVFDELIPASIAVPPVGQTVTEGVNATFSVTAAGGPPIQYQWRRNGAALAGATNASLTLSNLTCVDGASFSVDVRNTAGGASSAPVPLTVVDVTAPVITASPPSRTNNVGTTATFSVSANDCSPISYQWLRNGLPLAGETSATLTLVNVQLGDAASYSVRLTSAGGQSTSAAATLTVNRPPVAGDNGGTTTQNRPAVFTLAKLLRNDSDPDGDPLSVIFVTPLSLGGGSVVLDANAATYTPLPAFTGSDRFSYTISDGRGGADTADVDVFVSSGALPSLNQLSVTLLPNGHALVRFAGVPGRTYGLQRSTNLVNWTPLATLIAPAHGVIEYEDANPPGGGAFYRMALP